MIDHVERARLPDTDLGEDRCFEIGYFGHGDIVVATWQGPLDHEPRNGDGLSKRFGFSHGSDDLILASMAGFLTRAGKDKKEIGRIMLGAGEGILADGTENLRGHYNIREGTLAGIVEGNPARRYDQEESGLQCLVTPTPSQPGTFSEIGGTVIYTRQDTGHERTLLVFGRHDAIRGEDGTKRTTLAETEDFCEQDIPVMALLVCSLALGEYRRDLQAFLMSEFIEENEGHGDHE